MLANFVFDDFECRANPPDQSPGMLLMRLVDANRNGISTKGLRVSLDLTDVCPGINECFRNTAESNVTITNITPGIYALTVTVPGFSPKTVGSVEIKSALTTVLPEIVLSPVPSTSVTIVSPNGGETLTQGAQNSVSWQGGNGQVSVALVKANTTNQGNPTAGNLIIGWIGSKLPPNSSIIWDAKTICDLSLTTCKTIVPGSYKVMAVSQDANGNLTIWDHKQGKAGNWDVSNAAFSIK